jgi:hypothetical protein
MWANLRAVSLGGRRARETRESRPDDPERPHAAEPAGPTVPQRDGEHSRTTRRGKKKECSRHRY